MGGTRLQDWLEARAVRQVVPAARGAVVRVVRPFVVSARNEELVSALRERSEHGSFVITGDKGSGKTILLKWYVSQEFPSEEALLCSGADLGFAAFVKENQYFLDHVGQVPVLAIDDVDLLSEYDGGDTLLRLLFEERERRGLGIVVSSRKSYETLESLLSENFRGKAEAFELLPLGSADLGLFVRTMVNFYGQERRVLFDDEAVGVIAQFANGDVDAADKAVRYVVSRRAGVSFTVTAQDASSLLGIETLC